MIREKVLSASRVLELKIYRYRYDIYMKMFNLKTSIFIQDPLYPTIMKNLRSYLLLDVLPDHTSH